MRGLNDEREIVPHNQQEGAQPDEGERSWNDHPAQRPQAGGYGSNGELAHWLCPDFTATGAAARSASRDPRSAPRSAKPPTTSISVLRRATSRAVCSLIQ